MSDDYEPSYARGFLSLALGLSPMFVLFAVSAMFGANTVTFSGRNVYGAGALIVCIVLNIIFAAILAGLQKLGYIFLRIFRKKRDNQKMTGHDQSF
jgi:hypothetical protein